MKVPVAYSRIRDIVKAYRRTGTVQRVEDVIRTIKRDDDMRSDFLIFDRQRNRPTLISDHAFSRWIYDARYWELVDDELKSLTPEGVRLADGTFDNQLLVHLTDFVTRWKTSIKSINAELKGLTGLKEHDVPTLDNWYRAITRGASAEIPKGRFFQLVYLLVGAGAIIRTQYVVHTLAATER